MRTASALRLLQFIRNSIVLLAAIGVSLISLRAGSIDFATTGQFGIVRLGVQPSELPLLFAIAVDSPLSCWVASPSCIVLEDRVFKPTDIGTVLRFDDSRLGFAAAVGYLTDGAIDTWSFALSPSPGGGIGLDTSTMLPPRVGPDFIGYQVSEINLRINDLTFKQVQLPISTNPLIFGTFTEANFDVTITVRADEVPEPSSATLLAAALVAIALLGCYRIRLRNGA